MLATILFSKAKKIKEETEAFIGGDFTIPIGSEGTFSYYEGMLSSYIGSGTWELEGNLLILSENEKLGYDFVRYFEADENKLIFKESEFDNFIYVKVKDGDKFVGIDKIAFLFEYTYC